MRAWWPPTTPSMVRAAFVIIGDGETAREAVQLAWSIAWRRLGSVRDPERVGPWLVSIAANEARHLVKRRTPDGRGDLGPAPTTGAATQAMPSASSTSGACCAG